jgi:hypothetical protein
VTFNAVVRERLPLASARAAPLSLGRPTGQTSLNDAIALALAVPPVPDRRQMVLVFTDGFDSSSILTEDDVLAVAGRSPAAVFLVSRAIGSPWLPPMISKEAGGGTAPVLRGVATLPAKFFERLADATGGLSLQTSSIRVDTTTDGTRSTMRMTPNDNLLTDVFLRAFEDFRSSYLIRYSPTGVPRGGWHDVSVRVTRSGRHEVRVRSGYISG